MSMTISPPPAEAAAQDWENQTVFKDTVLDYIHVPKAVVHKIIDHEIFQRLHDIAQTGMASLYPGATHNRFCHSVGVYHLGKLAFERFQNNVKQQYGDDIYLVTSSKVSNDRVWARWRFLFEMSCLLHDCGHSPLSHTLEFLYDEYPQRENVESNQLLLECFQDDPDFKEQFFPMQKQSACGAPHERMSAAMLVQKDGGYYDILYELITSYLGHYDSGAIHVDGAERCDVVYGDSEFRSDLQFMVRAIIGCHYTENSDFWEYDLDPGKKRVVYQLRNCIISLLHSTIDVDNIDYSIRDASLSGYKSTQVDYKRLLTANTVVKAYDHANFELKDEPFDYSVCLREFVSAEATPEHPLSMTISGSATLLLEGDDLQGMVLTGNIVEEDGVCGHKPVRIVHLKKGSSVHILLEHRSVKITPRDVDRNIGAQLHIRGSSDTGASHGKLSGVINGTIFVGAAPTTGREASAVWERICAEKEKLTICPAYHKSAMSVIQGALDASNFEHLWIYSHHVTTYCNNYLSVYLLEQYADYCYWKEYTPFLECASRFLQILDGFELRPEERRKTTQEEREDYEKDAAMIRNVKYEEYADATQELSETLPECFGESALELSRTLFYLLKALRTIPRRHGAELFKKAAAALIRLMSSCAIPEGADWERLHEVEEELYQVNQARPKEHLGGSAVMRDLLGMPCVKQANGQNYLRTSDADLRSMYHALAINASDQDRAAFPELFNAIQQYESRRYLRPMWKSHTEFNFYTHGWNREWFIPLIELEKGTRQAGSFGGNSVFDLRSLSRIQYFFRTSKSPINRKNGFELYTSLSDGAVVEYGKNLRDFWDEVKKRFRLKTLVYVPQCIRHKDIDSSATYIVWKNRAVTLQDLGFQINQNAGRDYFYLYYQCEEDAGIDVMEFMDFLKEQIGAMATIAETPSGKVLPKGEAGGSPSDGRAEQEGVTQQHE